MTREYCAGCNFILLPEPWLGKWRCANSPDGARVPVFVLRIRVAGDADPHTSTLGTRASRPRGSHDEEAA
jgi:hypothetical protein